MDEKQLEQLSSSSGIPLELLSRSIQARAESSGVTPADILNSWSGGEAINPLPVSNEEVDVVAALGHAELSLEDVRDRGARRLVRVRVDRAEGAQVQERGRVRAPAVTHRVDLLKRDHDVRLRLAEGPRHRRRELLAQLLGAAARRRRGLHGQRGHGYESAAGLLVTCGCPKGSPN